MDRVQVSGAPASLPPFWLRDLDRTLCRKKLFHDGQKILVAVSGGVDSMVLLHSLHRLAPAHGWKLTAAHFNHQLRGRAADADERLVRKTAGTLNLACAVGRGDVRELARRKRVSLEMAGRELRHRFLARTARARGIATIALAHHADDQVELFFLRLFRGAGGQGIGGMKWTSPSPAQPSVRLVRPLLNQPKTELHRTAKCAAIAFSEDATNAQLDMDRNHIRRVLIPFLRENYPAPLTEIIPRLMELIGAEAETVTALARKWLASRRRQKFARLPAAVQRRVICLQLIALKHSPEFEMVERLREQAGEPFALDAKRTVSRDADGLLRLRAISKIAFCATRRPVIFDSGKGREKMDDFKLLWKVEHISGASFVKAPNTEYFDADKVGGRIWLRHWQPGDRFQPIGAATPRKLQDLLTNAKVPRAERHRLVVAATEQGRIFWVEGLRISEAFKLEISTARRLKWEWRREN